MDGPFHKQRQHFFWIFNTPLPHVGTFSLLFVGNFGQFLTPPPHVEHLGAHEIDFLKLSSKQIVISVLNRPIKSQYFMAWNWSTYWTSCVCLTFKPYKLHRELQYTCNWNRTRLFRVQSSEMQYICVWFIYAKLWNQVPSLDHFVVQNSGVFFFWKYKEVVCFHVSNLRQ